MTKGLRFDVLTLFPELFDAPLKVGVTRRAYDSGAVQVVLWPLRDFADGTYRRVDDRPFGGGPGMVMLGQPLLKALAAARQARLEAGYTPGPVIHFSPTGEVITQARIQGLSHQGQGGILLCGRYEGIDQRVLDTQVQEEWSLGDFVLSGGEWPALAVLDAVARLQPGVLHDAASHEQDSFSAGLLDCPHYTRPEVLDIAGQPWPVPPVLLSGHHTHIADWRRQQALEITAQRRPDLIEKARAQGQLSPHDECILSKIHL